MFIKRGRSSDAQIEARMEAMVDQADKVLYDRTHYKLSRKARAGDAEAALKMARYWLGEGPKKDPQNALWYLPGPARAGNTEARMLMVLALADGMNDLGFGVGAAGPRQTRSMDD